MMDSSYTLTTGNIGVLISMPHNGQLIPKNITETMTSTARNVPDTDWYMDKLYDFANTMGAYIISPKYSRYVIDLNRSSHGKALYTNANNTELCPTTAFDLSSLYLPNKQPSSQEISERISCYWQPYHQELTNTLAHLKQKYHKVVLLDAHSILSKVPRFFEGKLPDFNFGSADGISCDEKLMQKVMQLDLSPYTSISNGRFKGGYITRAYGAPKENVHAIQLELSQHTYMDEPSDNYNEQKASQVKLKLKAIVQCLIDFAQEK
ncbi:MAG: N-formylglutamate deformylase [Litorilituus sp.]|jgi:N-formylglutamate deformylase|nr:N-formylglutamate deformylase [Litorilituus sp.]